MSHLSERCKTDPDDENEIRNKRKQVQQFIQNSKDQQKKLAYIFKRDLDIQAEKIQQRIQKRNFNKPMSKSSSCGTYQSSNPISESQSLADTEDYQEELEEQTFLELDNQRDEKIYRVVQHYNNQINNIRLVAFNEETVQQMMLFEKQKWEEIQNISDQYELIKKSSFKQQ